MLALQEIGTADIDGRRAFATRTLYRDGMKGDRFHVEGIRHRSGSRVVILSAFERDDGEFAVTRMTPEQARELADALTRSADAVEGFDPDA